MWLPQFLETEVQIFLKTIVVCCIAVSILGFSSSARAQDKSKAPLAMTVPEWSTLHAAYDYDAKKPLNTTERIVKESTEDPRIVKMHLTLIGANGETVPGWLLRPKADGVYPCVLILHGLGSTKEATLAYFDAPQLVKDGFVVLALDAPLHGERKGKEALSQFAFPKVVREGNRDYRRAIDYLATRKDVDIKRIGLVGNSMGSMMGSILGAVDPRVRAFALCVGGDPVIDAAKQLPDSFRASVFPSCPSLYIGHIAPRNILMLNGRQDTVMEANTSNRLYAAAKQPKQQILYDSGHVLPVEGRQKAVAWIEKQLKAMK